MVLETINGPADVKALQPAQLQTLADEVREALIGRLSRTGGHVGSNLGVVELTVALHRVFSSPQDKIVWDVSHQCYAHKILTGRKAAYLDPAHFHDVTGFTNPRESEHDCFKVGHTATSVSLALGLAKGRDAAGGTENIIAVIGDGALGGGEAYEGLNTAGAYKKNLIIILNDNDQSVAENHGGLYACLKALRATGGNSENNFFRALGLDYRYLDDGHDVLRLVALLESVRDIDHPIVLHIRTIKGKGLPYAETDRENWHSAGPFHVADGSPKNGPPKYDTTVHDSLTALLERDKTAVVLTAGTPRALGFVGEDRAAWERTGRFVDVGIAEENAMAMASGIARYGGTAVFGVYAPFLQRAYDQLSHDLCLNNNPATVLVLLPGAFGMKSDTHLGLCDIPMLTHVPNLVYLAPETREEYLEMFRYATTQKQHPTAIRVPVRFYSRENKDETTFLPGRAKVLRKGSGTALIAVGALLPMALDAADAFEKETGRPLTVINPCFLSGVDEVLLNALKKDHRLVVTMEDGELDGGYGQRVASFYGSSGLRVINLGISKAFHSDFRADALLEAHGMSVQKIIHLIQTQEG
ncbi:MAG: 1-deoxy-D-xylulose-5-phosphate synthase [Clostridia bacterium]|nr:1-deoxy-D-xylulose-5-phosphate synthase [Clostridia bacterium]